MSIRQSTLSVLRPIEFERDVFGLWLFTPQGSLFRAEVDGAITECEVGQGMRSTGLAVLHLIPLSGWWMAQWTAEGERAFIRVEVCTPPAVVGGEWQFVDLELDPSWEGGLRWPRSCCSITRRG